MKKRIAFFLALLLVLVIVWGLWFGGFKIFGKLSELDDDGIHAFIALNFINTDGIGGSREDKAHTVRSWIQELEEKPYTEFVYGSAAQQTADQVRSAVLRYYYGLGPVRDYPPEVILDWCDPSRIVTDPNGILRIYPQYHPGTLWNTYFPPVDDNITFTVAAQDGSLTLSRSGTIGEFAECTVNNQTEVIWQDWDLGANGPWEGEETFVEVTMFRNGAAEYQIIVRIYQTNGLATITFTDDGEDVVQLVSGYVGEVLETVKLTSD